MTPPHAPQEESRQINGGEKLTTRITPIARKTALHALVARLLARRRPRRGRRALAAARRPGRGGRERLFSGVAFVNMAQEEIGARELVATVLAFVGSVAGVCGEALAME
jgi:hypothetical protein